METIISSLDNYIFELDRLAEILYDINSDSYKTGYTLNSDELYALIVFCRDNTDWVLQDWKKCDWQYRMKKIENKAFLIPTIEKIGDILHTFPTKYRLFLKITIISKSNKLNREINQLLRMLSYQESFDRFSK